MSKAYLRNPKKTDRAPNRYPIALQLRYRAKSKPGPVKGLGQTTMMSSKYIVFTSGDGLNPGMNVQIVIDWPRLQDGRICLELVLEVTITDHQDGATEAQIVTYHFRIGGCAEAQDLFLAGPFSPSSSLIH